MATVVSQDDLHDAIQDADFIGAVCDPSPKPTQALQLMSVDEAEMVARHMPLFHILYDAVDREWLHEQVLEAVIDNGEISRYAEVCQ